MNRTREEPNNGTLAYFIIRYRYSDILSFFLVPKGALQKLDYYLSIGDKNKKKMFSKIEHLMPPTGSRRIRDPRPRF
jgi:hypothetical protein